MDRLTTVCAEARVKPKTDAAESLRSEQYVPDKLYSSKGIKPEVLEDRAIQQSKSAQKWSARPTEATLKAAG